MTRPRATGGAGAGREQRRLRRTKVFLVAEVADGEPRPRRAHILDISPEGARLHARSVSQMGTPVDLMVGGARQPASVVWVKHHNFGVRFTSALSADRLETIVGGRGRPDAAGDPQET